LPNLAGNNDWDGTAPPGGAAPEPASLTLPAISGLALIRRDSARG
jgi:hypothetical protein